MITGIIVATLIAGCRSMPVPEAVPLPPEQTATGSMHDFANEATPQTPESLEVASSIDTVPVTASASGTIIIGAVTAPRLRIVTDPSCPYCQEFTLGDQLWMEQMYVAQGTLSLEIVYLPMDVIGTLNAKALLCSLEQNRFIDMDHSIAVKKLQSEAEAIARAKTLRISSNAFTACLRSKQTASILVNHQMIAESMQVMRVPSFTLGAERWIGIESRVRLQEMIEKAL